MENSKTYWCLFRIRTNSELKVVEELERRLKAANLYQYISRIVAPVEKVETMRNGKKVTVTKGILQGFMYIEFFYGATDELFRIIKTTRNVRRFYPGGLSSDIIDNIVKYTDDYSEKETVSDEKFLIGEKVKITDGPFKDFVAMIIEFDEEKMKIKASVSLFKRETTVELKTSQVVKYY